jgi:lysine/ornithine N-monooxygenase/glycine/D-amino acid oxidase-like deaminating enzyme
VSAHRTGTRVGVVGGGIAGCLLAWRLAGTGAFTQVDLLVAEPAGGADATGVSGGVVRGFEPDPAVGALAVASLAELRGSQVLRRWSEYAEVGSVYVRDREPDAGMLAAIGRELPGSVELHPGPQLAGWRGLPAGTVAVRERHAGHVSPQALRQALLRDLAGRPGVTVEAATVRGVQVGAGGAARCRTADGRLLRYDLLVLAAGRWTPRLLERSGLPGGALCTKSVQYTVYETGGALPPPFVDETTGIYGRPLPGSRLLLGLPAQLWLVDPDRPPATPHLHRRAAELAAERLPGLRLGPAVRAVAAADCYAVSAMTATTATTAITPDAGAAPADPATLSLRPVGGTGGRILTFSGGSGGSIKTALAASLRAATQLAGQHIGSTATTHSVTTHRYQGGTTMHDVLDDEAPYFHAIGIGAGPANLSLSALMQSATSERIALFDKQPGPAWHSSLLATGVRMQTSWLKDLVSLVDPTHKLSFLNYLVQTGRLFALLNAQFDVMPRREYERYLTWASNQLPDVHHGVGVDRISYRDHAFWAYEGDRLLATSRHLVLAVGTRSVTPPQFAHLPADRSFVADQLGWRIADMAADTSAPVAVVGGGQTGIECVWALQARGFTDIRWFGRRQWFQTIDDSPVANDFYRPAHSQFLQQLSRPTRRRLIEEQNVTGDALTPGALRRLYQSNYDGMLELGRFPVTLLPGRDVTAADHDGGMITLHCTTAEGHEQHRVGHVVIAAGRENNPIPFDDDLRRRVEVDDSGELVMDSDYSVRWKGMNGNRMYALNRARYSHGIPDANLTLLPVRSAIVLNSMFDRQMFQISDELCPVQWGSAA